MIEDKKMNINSYLSKKEEELKHERKINGIKYFILISLLSFFNFSTLVVAIYAIIRLDLSGITNVTGVALSSTAVSFVILLFFLHNFSVFYKAIMMDRTLKNAIDNIQYEVISYNEKIGKYQSDDALEILNNKVERIKEKALSKKIKNKKSLFIRIILGGLDA